MDLGGKREVKTYDYLSNEFSVFKSGIDFQRETFKDAKHHNDYDSMCDAIENIKSEIKPKLLKTKEKATVKKVEKVVTWYRTKEQRYSTITEDGSQIVFPPNIAFLVNKWLTKAYEILIEELENLDLLK